MPATRAQQWLSTLIASNGQQAGSVNTTGKDDPFEFVPEQARGRLRAHASKIVASLTLQEELEQSLQVRQYLKLALETLLRLTEFKTRDLISSGAHRIQQVADAVAALASDEEHVQAPLVDWLKRWSVLQGDASTLHADFGDGDQSFRRT
ncbi:hypothetical protein [Burkholderia multivorans]|uniref:hypothetical protein n=1 Tax=Burkholderia multivorans TaxID=87883 RepID=UPI0015E2B4DB|nr:hypothetical protein [Burkholderia multivorans]